jgi:hypothetical protein
VECAQLVSIFSDVWYGYILKLVDSASTDDILHIAEKLCAWIIWLIHEYLGDKGPAFKQHKEGRYLKFNT